MTALLCLSSLFPFSFMVKHGNRKYLCTFVNMKTFVIAGCGRLAGIVSEAVVKGLLPEYELVGAYSRTVAKAERIAGRMAEAGKSCAVCTTADELLALKPDILVETASPAALREETDRVGGFFGRMRCGPHGRAPDGGRTHGTGTAGSRRAACRTDRGV
jgi:aspartate dehydrogenase